MGGEKEITRRPLFAIRAVRFRSANDHFGVCRTRSRIGKGELSVVAARVACAKAHYFGLNFIRAYKL